MTKLLADQIFEDFRVSYRRSVKKLLELYKLEKSYVVELIVHGKWSRWYYFKKAVKKLDWHVDLIQKYDCGDGATKMLDENLKRFIWMQMRHLVASNKEKGTEYEELDPFC